MTKESLSGHIIAMSVNPDFWFFQSEICKKMKTDFDVKIHLYVGSEETKKYLQKTFDTHSYDSVSVRNFQHLPIKNSVDVPNVLKQSKKWERYLGINMAELVMTNRIYGRGYSLGAYYYPKAAIFDKNDHFQILDIFNGELEYWSNEIQNKEITLFINPGKIQAEICRKMDVLNRFFISSRFEDYYFWADDEFMLNPELKNLFPKISSEGLQPIEKEEGYVNDMVFRRDFFKRHGFKGFIKKTIHRIKGKIIAFIKTGGKEKSAYLWQSIRRDWRTFRDAGKMLDGRFITGFDKIQQSPFFFFPLQTEPEWTMQVQSPEFFSQLWAIALCAKSMPCEAKLAVKEHIYPLGMRPDNFYDQIVDFKNVEMISAKIHGLKVMRHCQAVITINGTSGYEAAMMGIPVILLGTLNDYDFLDHVFHCPKGEGLKEAVDKILADQVDLQKAKMDGARFAQAIKDSSVRTHDYSMLHREEVPPEMVDNAISSLLASV